MRVGTMAMRAPAVAPQRATGSNIDKHHAVAGRLA